MCFGQIYVDYVALKGVYGYARGRGVAPEPLNKCAEGAFQVARRRNVVKA